VPTVTATPLPELSWQIDKVIRATSLASKTRLLAADPGKVFLVIQTTANNVSLKPQPVYESRAQLRIPKGASDWSLIGVDGPATGAAGETFDLTPLNSGFLGEPNPVIEPTRSERFVIAYAIPLDTSSPQFVPQGAAPIDLTREWAGAEVHSAASPTPRATSTPTRTSTPIPPTPLPTPTGTPSPLLKVVKVIDGDRFRVDLGGGKQDNVRIIGIDAPELVNPDAPVQCFSREALAKARELLEGKRVRLLVDTTQVDRHKEDALFRYVEREDGLDVGLELIKGGYVHEYAYYIRYPRQPQYQAAEAAARDAGSGLWNAGTCGGNTTQAATPTPTPTKVPTKTPTKTPPPSATPPPKPTSPPRP
jgi:micrococcal nuclease